MPMPVKSLARLVALTAVLPLLAAIHRKGGSVGSRASRSRSDPEQCVALSNREVYFGVKVELGTPAQEFMLVADTGSNNLVVVSCVCTEAGGCTGAAHCFKGTNRSSSFKIDTKPPQQAITFGSGTIQTVAVTEQAAVGGVIAHMEDHVMLLVDDSLLNIAGPFEGILGLGLPFSALPQPEGAAATSQQAAAEGGLDLQTSFLEDAGVTSFAMCFNAASDGAMRMNHVLKDTMKSVGTVHWGLGLSGIIVGGKGTAGGGTALVSCSEKDANKGYETPCGVIPDSGTTLMMGPPMHVVELYSALCTEWPLCNSTLQELLQEVTGGDDVTGEDFKDKLSPPSSGAGEMMMAAGHGKQPGEDSTYETVLFRLKAKLFVGLLAHCDSWMKTPQDFDSLPSLRLNTTDTQNKTRLLELTPWTYVLQLQVAQEPAGADLIGLPPALGSQLQVKLARDHAPRAGATENATLCTPAIGMMEYGTKANGPVWIAGSPLFYEYEVGYDLEQRSMSFTKLDATSTGCQPCMQDTKRDPQNALLSVRKQGQKRLRGLSGTPRKPSIDTTQPL